MTNRRHFVLGTVGGMCSIPALLMPHAVSAQVKDSPFRQEAIATWRRRIRSILEKGRLPIVDLQATYVEARTDVPRMIELMNELDVAQIAFAPAFARLHPKPRY